MPDNCDHITTCTCDDCGVKGPCVALHHYGEPVMFLCRPCSPKIFESTARREIDAWLGIHKESLS